MTSPHGTEYQNEKKTKILILEDRVNAIKRESARSITKALGCTNLGIY